MSDNTNDFLIRQQLQKWETELEAALQILRGERLVQFQNLIARIANKCQLKISETGTFTRVEPDNAK